MPSVPFTEATKRSLNRYYADSLLSAELRSIRQKFNLTPLELIEIMSMQLHNMVLLARKDEESE